MSRERHTFVVIFCNDLIVNETSPSASTSTNVIGFNIAYMTVFVNYYNKLLTLHHIYAKLRT